MIDRFPYGKAPFWLAVFALASLFGVLWTRNYSEAKKPDLVFALSAPNHVPSYQGVARAFEQKHGVKVGLQLVNSRALTTRLQNAMLAGTEVPDLVELGGDAMTFLARGPLDDVGLLDLTARLDAERYRERLVESRLSLWSSRGRLFALPHDVHPVMLMYRADIVASLGIKESDLETWDDFVRVGRRITADLDGDGVNDRYMIDLPYAGAHGLTIVLLQRGIGYFDAQNRITFNQPLTVDTMLWYLQQTHGKQRIAFECGWGQSLAKAMTDGLALFIIAPDWRTKLTEVDDAPHLKGKMKLMPLPAWDRGGRRTSVWGGSGLAIAKRNPNRDLAWKFAKELYFDPVELGKRFAMTNILPPFEDAWDLPEFHQPSAYFSGQAVGALYAELAPQTPPVWSNEYSSLAEAKVSEAFLRAVEYHKANGEVGLREFVQCELDAAEAYVARSMARNVFLRQGT